MGTEGVFHGIHLAYHCSSLGTQLHTNSFVNREHRFFLQCGAHAWQASLRKASSRFCLL